MAYISCNKLRESEFDNVIFKRDKLQDLNVNQLKLEVHDSYKRDGKIPTNFEPTDDSDVMKKTYLDKKLLKKTATYHYQKKIITNFLLNYNK